MPSLTVMPDFTAPNVPTVNKVTDATKNVIGKAEANAKVTLYINDKLQGTKTADKAGNYKFSIKKQKVGTKIKVIATDAAGNVSDAKIITVIDKTAPAIPTVNKVNEKSKYVTGKAEKYTTVKVYNGKKLLGKATANSKGAYNVKIKAQKQGTKLTISATDKAGNQSKLRAVKVSKVTK